MDVPVKGHPAGARTRYTHPLSKRWYIWNARTFLIGAVGMIKKE
jgi:hypothetical protein